MSVSSSFFVVVVARGYPLLFTLISLFIFSSLLVMEEGESASVEDLQQRRFSSFSPSSYHPFFRLRSILFSFFYLVTLFSGIIPLASLHLGPLPFLFLSKRATTNLTRFLKSSNVAATQKQACNNGLFIALTVFFFHVF